MTEVGDYFCVPEELKAFPYMNMLVTQRNYKFKGYVKLIAVKIPFGTIVMVAQIAEELPPHEFVTPEGILCSTSRNRLREFRSSPSAIGEKAITPKRTQKQVIDSMHWEVRNNNLPWWYDSKSGKLIVNSKLIKEPEAELFFRNKFNPGAETPYPEHYNLGPDYLIKEPPAEDEDEDYENGVPMINTGEDDVDLEQDDS